MSKAPGPKSPLYEPGDVFTVPLPNEWFGAVRILQRGDDPDPGARYLVTTIPYLAREPATLGDPQLGEILTPNYFAWVDSPAVRWVLGGPPDRLSYLGRLELSDQDRAIQCDSLRGAWKDDPSDEAYLQWRWHHDRPALLAERKKRDEELIARLKRERQKPKKMLADEDFWGLISLLDQPADNDETADRGLECLIAELANRTKTDIKRFEETLTYKLFLLDTKAHADASVNSVDGFLYARCAVVASGPAFYESVLADPTKMPSELWFEDLLGVSAAAYERKTGKDFEYDTGCCYETGSNVKGWPDE